MTSVKSFAHILGQVAHLWDKFMDISAALQAWNQSLALCLSTIWLSLKEIPSSLWHRLLKHLFYWLSFLSTLEDILHTAAKLLLPIGRSTYVTFMLKFSLYILSPLNQTWEMAYVQLFFTPSNRHSCHPVCWWIHPGCIYNHMVLPVSHPDAPLAPTQLMCLLLKKSPLYSAPPLRRTICPHTDYEWLKLSSP